MPYPDEIDTFRAIENLPGLVYDANDKRTFFVEDLQAVRNSVTDIEETLGLLPQGEYAAVSARLDQIEQHIQDIMLGAAYPIGTIFETTDAGNPAALLGFGTWEVFGAGKVLVGLDASDPDFDTVLETRGAKTHTLTTAEIPAHTHSYNEPAAPVNSGVGLTSADVKTRNVGVQTGSTGGGGAHNNIQPSIVVYRWRRTA